MMLSVFSTIHICLNGSVIVNNHVLHNEFLQTPLKEFKIISLMPFIFHKKLDT